MYVWPRLTAVVAPGLCSRKKYIPRGGGVFSGFIYTYLSSHFCLVVILVIFPFPNYYCRKDTMHSSSLLFLIGFHLWFLPAGQHGRNRRNASAFSLPRAGQRRGVGWLKYNPPRKHATTTVDFQQGTVKVTLSSIGNVANHRASFTDCVGASGRGWNNDVEGKRKKKKEKIHKGGKYKNQNRRHCGQRQCFRTLQRSIFCSLETIILQV